MLMKLRSFSDPPVTEITRTGVSRSRGWGGALVESYHSGWVTIERCVLEHGRLRRKVGELRSDGGAAYKWWREVRTSACVIGNYTS